MRFTEVYIGISGPHAWKYRVEIVVPPNMKEIPEGFFYFRTNEEDGRKVYASIWGDIEAAKAKIEELKKFFMIHKVKAVFYAEMRLVSSNMQTT